MHPRAKQPSGAVIYDGPSRLDGERILVIVTGLDRPSKNPKTGAMIQCWILCADLSPVAASQSGADASVCGGCKLRHFTSAGTGRPICYVGLIHAPRAVWDAWSRGKYPTVQPHEIPRNRPIRLGAYGDPSAVPLRVWRALCGHGHTAYTHGWRTRPALATLAMASVDTPAEATEAQAKGWRTFRVRSSAADPLLPSEIVCPASAEGGKRTTCSACQLCDGAHEDDQRRSIAIINH